MMALPDPPNDAEKASLEALLRWYVAMGADAAIGETPRDSFEAEPPTRAAPAVGAGSVAQPRTIARAGQPAHGSSQDLIAHAATLAAAATSLDELRERWAGVPGCTLATTAASMIFSGGADTAPLMIVAGAPDADDERQGQIFCGAKGRLLDAMLRALGLDRTQVRLGNVVPWRPPGNRQPTPLELGLCLPFARAHIALAKPEILLCLGERAAQPLLGSRDPISRLRGRWMRHEGDSRTVRALATFSLDFLLTQPLQKKRAWSDLLMLAEAMRDLPPPQR